MSGEVGPGGAEPRFVVNLSYDARGFASTVRRAADKGAATPEKYAGNRYCIIYNMLKYIHRYGVCLRLGKPLPFGGDVTAQSPLLWLLGLAPEDRRVVRETAGDGYQCRLLDDMDASALASALEQDDDPLLLWLGSGVWRTLRREHPGVADLLQLVPAVLVLEADADRPLLEQALEGHFQQVARFPLDRKQVFEALSRAREARNMYQDMARMAREIMMERELLERKSEVCAFLFQAFAGLDGAADARELMACCRQAMKEAFPVKGVRALWWGSGGRAAYLLDASDGSAEAEAWRAFLRERTGMDGAGDGEALVGRDNGKKAPEPERTLLLPLEIRKRRCGILALDLERPLLPGRDLALALDAVRKHLAFILWERGGDEEFFAASSSTSASSDSLPQKRRSASV